VHRTAPATIRSVAPTHQLREHAERVEPLGQAVAVAAMGGSDDVVRSQRPAGADRRSLLADRQVDEARYEPVTVEPRDTFFEAADEEHPLVHLKQI